MLCRLSKPFVKDYESSFPLLLAVIGEIQVHAQSKLLAQRPRITRAGCSQKDAKTAIQFRAGIFIGLLNIQESTNYKLLFQNKAKLQANY